MTLPVASSGTVTGGAEVSKPSVCVCVYGCGCGCVWVGVLRIYRHTTEILKRKSLWTTIYRMNLYY